MSTRHVEFGYLDRQSEIGTKSRNLPHWFQPGAAIFVTFRTHDSMPRDVILRWQRELVDWLRRMGLPTGLAIATANGHRERRNLLLKRLPENHRIEFQRLADRFWHQSLDECHGQCHLKKRKLAKTVADAIRYFDGMKYDLDRLVVMPNHVHALVQFRKHVSPSLIGQSWMRYTARKINKALGTKGNFWQPEPFDHIVRNENQFAYLQGYIADNPRKASLRDGEFLYWER